MTELEKFLELDRKSKLENDMGLLSTKRFLFNIAKSFLLGDKEKAIYIRSFNTQIRGVKKYILIMRAQ